mgnify:FL=1
MKELARVSLYRSFKETLVKINRSDNNYKKKHYIFELFGYPPKTSLNNYDFKLYMKNLIDLLDLNIVILDGIEESFLIDSEKEKIDKQEFKKIFSENVKKIKKSTIIRDYKNIENKIFVDFVKKIENVNDEFYAYNSLINLLNDINNTFIKDDIINIGYIKKRVMNDNGESKNQVFLSHAFDDKLYTLSLFIFMYERDIFLYVDWMFTRPFGNGENIKINLSNELSKSLQLLFLRTINSEFNIRGSGNIRGWCSWELGNFYIQNKGNRGEKYYIELYKNKTKQKRNRQLDGIKPLNKVEDGKLK